MVAAVVVRILVFVALSALFWKICDRFVVWTFLLRSFLCSDVCSVYFLVVVFVFCFSLRCHLGLHIMPLAGFLCSVGCVYFA